ncbi:unnamed protein product [Lampetra planeri]
MSVEFSPPPPLPPPPPPPPAPVPAASAAKKKLYQTISSSRSPVEGDHTEARSLLTHRESWCGLVALWMAAHLRQRNVDMDAVVQTALSRGFTAQGEMFSGVLLGLDQGSVSKEDFQLDPTLPWLYLPGAACSACPARSPGLREVYVLAKQGKSLRYQLWSLDSVAQSNGQLKTMDPQRARDGTQYVVPVGGVEVGLAGQAVLLHTRTK